ncbi:pullulanase [Ideonella dechloratans]|uniref:Pullulanase n=1 Tax=Ideonella dechloratans TaxID=36863 RepID=A0A643F8U4_IDEDE|nr:pullulanase-associated domain-containing protein [Ideonella dechloratans]KAB0577094.1 pullulanase [Ideonella dechloratans]UFU12327.1 pullulanase [Ideonella dechloratans]
MSPILRRSVIAALCGTALSLLSLPAAQAQDAPSIAPLPDGMVAIHYHRPDGNYDGWGVHLWESYEKVENGKVVGGKSKSDQPIMGITWMNPLKPTGQDGFGAYWQVKADEFRNGKYNYIIHKGDSKDCTKDSQWFSTQGPQIFINQGDCTAYLSAEDAIKARK